MKIEEVERAEETARKAHELKQQIEWLTNAIEKGFSVDITIKPSKSLLVGPLAADHATKPVDFDVFWHTEQELNEIKKQILKVLERKLASYSGELELL